MVAGPLGVWAGEVDPPDPAGLAVTIAVPFCCISLFLVWLWGPAVARKTRRIAATLVLLLGLPTLALYLLTYFSIVVSQPIPTAEGIHTVRVTIGDELRQRIKADDRNSLELLMDYAFDPAAIWTQPSIRSNQVKLNALFILSFILLTAGVALISIRSDPSASD